MSEIRIPEDLRTDYQFSLNRKPCALDDLHRDVVRLIERIARAEAGLDMAVAENHEIAEANADLRARVAALEAENGRLRETLMQISFCREHPECNAARAARATLAQQPSPPKKEQPQCGPLDK